jgi:hypothetical protein
LGELDGSGALAQGVISARLMLFAAGAPNAADEAALMVSEKIVAFANAGIAADRALKSGLSRRGIGLLAAPAMRSCQQRPAAQRLALT